MGTDRIEHAIRSRLNEGAYTHDGLPALADAVTRDLFAVTRDKHLVVAVVPEAASSGGQSEGEERQSRARRENFGVRRVEILAGNVGYLDLRYFYRPEEASAAMSLLQHADALILDMRNNGGGSPDTVALLASYLFEDAKLPLFSIVPRQTSEAKQYTTAAIPPPERNAIRSVFGTHFEGDVLRRRRTGVPPPGAETSGSDWRADGWSRQSWTAVSRERSTDSHVPNGQVRTAIAHANWEGTGVAPDVAADAADALRVAHARALEQLLTKFPTGPWHEALRQHLAAVQGG